MKRLQHILTKGAEGVAAAMLAAMFLTFLLQIFSRYVLKSPFGWTLELCLTLWLWMIFWGNAFVVSHDEHVSFDVIYRAVSQKTRKIFALIGAVCIVVGLAISVLPTWDYIDFLKIKKSATLRIPLRTVFSIYMVFLFATILAYAYRAFKILRSESNEAWESPDNLIPPERVAGRFSDRERGPS